MITPAVQVIVFIVMPAMFISLHTKSMNQKHLDINNIIELFEKHPVIKVANEQSLSCTGCHPCASAKLTIFARWIKHKERHWKGQEERIVPYVYCSTPKSISQTRYCKAS